MDISSLFFFSSLDKNRIPKRKKDPSFIIVIIFGKTAREEEKIFYLGLQIGHLT